MTDLNAWQNAAIRRAFGHNLSIADTAHVFDLSQQQVCHLKVKWRAMGDLTLAQIVGCPRIASCILVHTAFIPEERADQSCVHCCPAESWSRCRKNGCWVMADLGLCWRAGEQCQSYRDCAIGLAQEFLWMSEGSCSIPPWQAMGTSISVLLSGVETGSTY